MPTYPLLSPSFFVVQCYWLQDALSIFINLYCVSTLLMFIAKIPVFGMAYVCDNNKQSAPEKTSFHRLPINKSSLLKR